MLESFEFAYKSLLEEYKGSQQKVHKLSLANIKLAEENK